MITGTLRLTPKARFKVGLRISKRVLMERIQFDWVPARTLIFLIFRLRYKLNLWRGRYGGAVDALGKAWRIINLPSCTEYCERNLGYLLKKIGPVKLCAEWAKIAEKSLDPAMEKRLLALVGARKDFWENRGIILKTKSGSEKGVLLLTFSNYFPYFFKLFKEDIYRDYHVVLEPSWVGYFVPDILIFLAARERVFVQGVEDRDLEFLRSLKSNLVPMRLAANYWVHPDIFHPIEGVKKEYDFIIVALWADFKRHYALFRALKALGNKKVRCACVGQPWPRTLQSIRDEAAYYGVADQVDFYEDIPQKEVNVLFNKSKAHILTSRKEGSNRVIIEAMFAGVPSFLLEGFNYGTRYPYFNAQTGGFVKEKDLPALMQRIHDDEFASLKPRQWVLDNMSPVIATKILEREIYGGENGALQVKVNAPELQYFSGDGGPGMNEEYLRIPGYLA